MDGASGFFDKVQKRSIVQTGKMSAKIQTSGSEKKHVAVVLTAVADRFTSPPMIIFNGKTNLTIKAYIFHHYPGKSAGG